MLRPRSTSPRRSRALRWILAVVGVVVIVALSGAAYLFSLANTFDTSRHVAARAFPASRPPAATGVAAKAVNILLLGIDDHSEEARKAGLPSTRAADMVAVIHIPADRSRIYLMSILRNSLVSLPRTGPQPISAALAYGGVPLEVQAVESILRVRMDHVVSVSVPGLKGLTNALGGVTVTNPSAFTSEGYSFRTGRVKLNGAEAVAFVRRGGGPAAARAQAQESYVHGALQDLLSAKTLLNPVVTSTVVSVLSPYLTVDQALDGAYVGRLGIELRNLRADDVSVFRLPTAAHGRAGGMGVLELDQQALPILRQHFRADTLNEYVP